MNRLAQIHTALGTHPWQGQIYWFDTIGSTNTRLKQMALEGAPHGTVLIADHQTAGRGRMGRSFCSPEDMGIYMSVLLRPGCGPEQLMHLTCAAAIAACDAVEEAVGIPLGIKWTNDLVHGRRKVAGILTELVTSPGQCCAVVGIGINCRQNAGDFPAEIADMAGSLTMAAQKAVDLSALTASLIRSFYAMDRELLTGKESMLARYRQRCVTLGKEVCILRADRVEHARAVDIDSQGGLVVVCGDGCRKTVSSGEVSVRGMYGYI